MILSNTFAKRHRFTIGLVSETDCGLLHLFSGIIKALFQRSG